MEEQRETPEHRWTLCEECLQNKMCDCVIDPYVEEVEDKIEMRWLCDECYKDRLEQV